MNDFGEYRYEFPSFVSKPVEARYTESKHDTSCDKLRLAEDALKYALFNLDAWVYGGRFAITESERRGRHPQNQGDPEADRRGGEDGNR